MVFTLDPQLAKDSVSIIQLGLSDVRLMNNAIFPWVMLIPQRANCVELLDLKDQDRTQLFDEILMLSNVMKSLYDPTKLNVANLGNVVSQLHIHIIARYDTDPAWPNPVWGAGFQSAYTEDAKAERLQKIKRAITTILS